MGADKYTKEKKEFYENIMQEIKMHQDFGERNPVDIGIECGYSEDDVMGMIYMCQDIIASESPEIPVRENWELEGIIPYEEFVKIDFPEIIKNKNIGNTTDVNQAFNKACDYLKLEWVYMEWALKCANKLKDHTLCELTSWDGEAEPTIDGFRDIVKWTSHYGVIYSSIANNESAKDISIKTMLPVRAVEEVIKLIELEKEFGFTPLDQMILESNGWADDINLPNNS